MRFKTLIVFAIVAAVSACETTTDESGMTGGGSGVGSQPGVMSGAGPGVSQAALSAEQAQQQLAGIGDRVFFAFDQYDLDGRARSTLEQQAAFLNKYPSLTVTIEGHADERGTREYNLALGERRANAAKDYLVALGVDPGRINTISYGEERPIVVGSNEQARAQNRTAITVVTGGRVGS